MTFIKSLIYKLLNKQISNIYNKRFDNFNNTPKGVFWNSKLSQDLRLNIILDKILQNTKSDEFSIADIGCGYGRLYEIIRERKLDGKVLYHGFDINQKIISFCKNNIDFEIFDGFLFDSRDIKNSIKILECIKNIKKPKVLDAEENTTNELLNYFSHVVFSYQGLKSFTGIDNVERALKTFAQKTKFQTLVTNGEHGCYYIQDKMIKNIPAIKIKAVDTLAAGDVWHGAFLFELVKKSSLVNSIKFANYIASLKCKKFGGSSGSPFIYEINENVVL